MSADSIKGLLPSTNCIMCGRFGLSYPRSHLMDWYRARAMPEYKFRYNIPPTADIVAIRDDEAGPTGSLMRWGLIPWWVKEGKKAPLLHTARSETIAAKPIFKASFYRRRCIIPASGFFEWERLPDGRKQPFYISSMDGNPLSFAGIWDTARLEGIRIDSCAASSPRTAMH